MTREKAGRICDRARWLTLFLMVDSLLAGCISLVFLKFTGFLVALSAAYGLYLIAALFAALRAIVDPEEPDGWKRSPDHVRLG